MMLFSVPLKLLIPFVDNPPEYYFFRTTKIWACCPIKDVGRSPRNEGMVVGGECPKPSMFNSNEYDP